MDALAGTQIGSGVNAFLKTIPSAANRSTLGALTKSFP